MAQSKKQLKELQAINLAQKYFGGNIQSIIVLGSKEHTWGWKVKLKIRKHHVAKDTIEEIHILNS